MDNVNICFFLHSEIALETDALLWNFFLFELLKQLRFLIY